MAIIYPLYVCMSFIFAPASAMIPKADIEQYTNVVNTPFSRSVKYFKNQAQKNKIIIATDDYQIAQEALVLSLANNPNIIINEYNQPLEVIVPLTLAKYADNMPAYLVTIRGGKFIMPGKYNMKLINSEKLGNGNKYMVFQVLGKRSR